MNFVLIGYDAAADRFLEAALARRHRLVAFVDVPSDFVAPPLAGVPRLQTLEEISGVSGVDFLVLSGSVAERSERLKYIQRLDPVDLVLAVPLAEKPDVYYEFSLGRNETKINVLPLMPELCHPGLDRIEELLNAEGLGSLQWMEWTHPLPPEATGLFRFLEGWSWLRRLGGEITSVAATGATAESSLGGPVMISARSDRGILTTVRWMPGTSAAHRLHLEAEHGSIDCELPEGFDGPALLRLVQRREPADRAETIDALPCGVRWVLEWERVRVEGDSEHWTSATRQIELAEAVERSLTKERAVSLTYDEFSEETSFKSIMTTLGCGLVWLTVLVAILVASGVPLVGYLVLPILVLFLALQLFGFVYRKPESAPKNERFH